MLGGNGALSEEGCPKDFSSHAAARVNKICGRTSEIMKEIVSRSL
jgi:hypothetical protein